MSAEQNKAISRRIPVEVFEQDRLAVVDEICAPEFIEHGTPPPGIPAGREGIKAMASALRKGFPDIKYKIDQQIGEGDGVASYVTVSGSWHNDKPRGRGGYVTLGRTPRGPDPPQAPPQGAPPPP